MEEWESNVPTEERSEVVRGRSTRRSFVGRVAVAAFGGLFALREMVHAATAQARASYESCDEQTCEVIGYECDGVYWWAHWVCWDPRDGTYCQAYFERDGLCYGC